MKELLTLNKAISDDNAAIQRLIDDISAKKAKHETRVDEHMAEIEEAEGKLASVIEDMAREKASEKDLDRAHAVVETLKSKGAALAKVLEVINRDLEENLRVKAERENELAKVQEKIALSISDSLIEALGEPLLDAYAVCRFARKRYLIHGGGFSLREFFNLLIEKHANRNVDQKAISERGQEILGKYLK